MESDTDNEMYPDLRLDIQVSPAVAYHNWVPWMLMMVIVVGGGGLSVLQPVVLKILLILLFSIITAALYLAHLIGLIHD